MCHEFICATCELVSWKFCEKVSALETCPDYSCTAYKTDRLCDTCERINTALDELWFWLARHPARAVSYEGTEEDDTLSVVSFYNSDDEEMKKKAVAKPDTPWGVSTAPANWEDENEEDENEEPGLSEDQEEEDQDDSYDFEETKNKGDVDFETYDTSSSEICMGW